MKPAPPVTRTGRGSAGAAHATSPRASSSARICSTRSSRGLLARPTRRVRRGPAPKSCRAREAERRRRPASCRRSSGGCRRSAPCRRSRARGRSCPSRAASSVATSVTERSWPEPMLNVPPAACGSTSASAKARATSRDVDEVAALLAVLEDHRLLAVEQPRGEDREHAGIGVGERLAGAVDVEQAQAHALHAVGRGHDVGGALLHIFVERVDRGRGWAASTRASATGVSGRPCASTGSQFGEAVAQRRALGILDQRRRRRRGRGPRHRSTSTRR